MNPGISRLCGENTHFRVGRSWFALRRPRARRPSFDVQIPGHRYGRQPWRLRGDDPETPGAVALRAFARWGPLLGIHLVPGKSEVGNWVGFLGLQGSASSAANRPQLHISRPESKRKIRSDFIDGYIKEGETPPQLP